MDHFSNVIQTFASATVTAPAHVCEELLKLHGIDFHDNPLVIEMPQSPLEQPPRMQWVIHSYENTVKHKKKDIVLFAESIPKVMRIKDINSRLKGRKIHLKSFSAAKASQLNHYIKPTLEEYKYDCVIIHIGINDIPRNKNDADLNNLPDNMFQK